MTEQSANPAHEAPWSTKPLNFGNSVPNLRAQTPASIPPPIEKTTLIDNRLPSAESDSPTRSPNCSENE
jgi:hypothetical protein